MSKGLVDRFFQMSKDPRGRDALSNQQIDPAQVTEPALITDEKLCGQLGASFGLPVPGAAEGGTFYKSGPYIIYSPWRDHNRRNEWSSKAEFVALIVLDRDMKPIGAIAM
jgi:hypothetical protein